MGIKRIAKLANVSIGTVDRVLHKRSGVAKETEKRVLKIIKETGYVKNTSASRLKLASVKKIRMAVLSPRENNTQQWNYWRLPKEGILKAVEELSEMGVEVDFYSFLNSTSFAARGQEIFAEDYDALVTVPFFKKESNELQQLAKAKEIPVVFLDTEIALDGPANFIRQNSHNAGRVAGRLLHGLVGDKGDYFIVNIINDKGVHANGQQREDGFRAFFKSINQKVSIQSIQHAVDVAPVFTKEVIEKLKKDTPKGIFVTNSRAHLIAQLLNSHGVGNAFVVGFDLNERNLRCLQQGEINFLINQKPDYQGYAAIKGLFNFLTKEDASALDLQIPVEIIVKENAPEF